MADSQLQLTAVWDDPDMIELRVSAGNGGFSGSTHVYVGLDELSQAASSLAGFPRSPDDRRQLSWGSEDAASHLGLVQLAFRCRDRTGHPVVDVQLVSSDMGEDPPGQSVRLSVPFEAASLDAFVAELPRIERAKRGIAVLRGAGGITTG